MSIPKDFGTVVFLFLTALAAQKVPVTKKVDDGVYSVCRRNLKYTVLYQQLATFIPRRLLRKYRRRRRSTMAYILASRKPDEVYSAYQQLAKFIPRRLLRKYRRRRRLTMAYILYVEETWWCIRCFISSLLSSFHAGCSESAGDEEGRRWRTPCTSRRPDEVYGALSAASTVVLFK